ncbi:cytochrome c oxidase subunit 4 [Propioniciclava tarda]|uniref:Cytochrome c oxidase polypeptide 4 n=1 Tax=Propioniciclava tarda TaxID=433330 RepID=A0A4Q9KJX6_PROTD|nr:cytochrome c oxidase subunit 4 [Propioniciclava tarda]TBT94708.1 cytochrome c oxidase subunit 4 [Propioniciclava tarda]SMO65481.1 Cytochrome c oxidase subunit IV [Propioniciclava tarda]HOA87766.1 cytochrome c oxidase subunit 4 [Propioniciclava tarda]HQA29823.1 cytochrome c oxidase subunit 4 [Propioniciclava tarda]HQD59760.1 cytochrome c oxidase subunit 4 [Propioniciclava tarda]
MKVEARLFLFLWVFFLIVTGIYLWASLAVYHAVEPIGQTVFILCFAMTLMIWFYLWVIGRKMNSRPEDNKGGEVAQGAGALGFFPPKSMWPFVCSIVCSILVLGPVFGWWLTIMGALIGVWAVCGWCYEYYVGDYRH